MSQENVEIAKRALDAFNRRDLLDAYDDFYTPDFEWFPAITGFTGVSYRGREGLEAYLREINDTWEEFCVRFDEFRDLGDRVVMLGKLEGRGRGSGVPVETPHGVIIDFRDGTVSCMRTYVDHGEALKAVGLEA